jgi:hypothetical protein
MEESMVTKLALRHLAVIGALLLLAGCGADARLMRVWGLVKIGGQPLDAGTIEFDPSEGTRGARVIGTIHGGLFEINARVGPRAGGIYTVRITAPMTDSAGKTDETIAAAYNTESTLRVNVSPDPVLNHFDFHVTKKVEPPPKTSDKTADKTDDKAPPKSEDKPTAKVDNKAPAKTEDKAPAKTEEKGKK